MAGSLIVVDASCLYEILSGGKQRHLVMEAMAAADELAAPELIDVEVTGLVRRDAQRGRLDGTRCDLALDLLADWPAERYPHRPFIPRVWELRDNVRTADAFYVALAEVLDASVITFDGRLSRASGLRCPVIALGE